VEVVVQEPSGVLRLGLFVPYHQDRDRTAPLANNNDDDENANRPQPLATKDDQRSSGDAAAVDLPNFKDQMRVAEGLGNRVDKDKKGMIRL
jgi:hypothetical protein